MRAVSSCRFTPLRSVCLRCSRSGFWSMVSGKRQRAARISSRLSLPSTHTQHSVLGIRHQLSVLGDGDQRSCPRSHVQTFTHSHVLTSQRHSRTRNLSRHGSYSAFRASHRLHMPGSAQTPRAQDLSTLALRHSSLLCLLLLHRRLRPTPRRSVNWRPHAERPRARWPASRRIAKTGRSAVWPMRSSSTPTPSCPRTTRT